MADGNADVRYNAATWVASRGDAKAVPVLAEMLDPEELAGIELEQQKALREDKRLTILANALKATGLLAEKNPGADLSSLEPELEKLEQSGLDERLKVEARRVLGQIKSERPAGKGN